MPNDMSLMERMLRIGVRFSMMEQTTVDYYPSTLWADPPNVSCGKPTRADPEDYSTDPAEPECR